MKWTLQYIIKYIVAKEDTQMSNKHKRRCSTSCVIRKIKTKITIRDHCTPLEWPESRALTSANVGEGGEQQALACIAGGSAKECVALEGILTVPVKLNVISPCNPVATLLGIYPKGLKSHVHIKTLTWMFTAALFVIGSFDRTY